MKSRLFFISAFLLIAGASQAWTYTLTTNTLWSDLPFNSFSNYDEIAIPAGKTLILQGTCDELESLDLIISVTGTLNFGTNGSNADELYLSSSSVITLYGNGIVYANTCVGQKSIYFGGTRTATCTGSSTGGSTGTTYHTFNDINTAGGISASGPVPVTWLNYEAVATEMGANIIWSTASEKNNSHFEVEYSTDGLLWETVGYIPSKAEGGNSDEILEYNYNHEFNTRVKAVFYRLKQTDFNGEFSYSETMVVEIVNTQPVVISNESEQSVRIRTTLNSAENAEVSVYTMTGMQVASIDLKETDRIILSKPGIYLFEVRRNGRTEVIKHAVL